MADFPKKEQTKEKTSIYSSKVFISICLLGFAGFVVLIAFVISIFYEVPQTNQNTNNNQLTSREIGGDPLITIVSIKPKINDSDPVRGLPSAPITIVEFGDFDCPYCATMNSVLKEVLRAYPEQVRLVWKDYPINSLDNKSHAAAVAARCAQSQGKFWEMHDLIFADTDSYILPSSRFAKYAEELNLNLEEFNQCLESESTGSQVENGIQEAEDLLIEATPHFYIEGQEISGIATLDDFKKLIEIELEP